MNPQNKPCNCYVSRLTEMARFSVRRGAHEYACPEYRESRDPVDRVKDIEYRHRHLEYRETRPSIQARSALERRKNIAYRSAVLASWISVDLHNGTEWAIHGMALVAFSADDEELDEELEFLSELAGFRYRMFQGFTLPGPV